MHISEIPSTHLPTIVLVDNKRNQETFTKTNEERIEFKGIRSKLRRMKVSNKSQSSQAEKKYRSIK